MERVRTRRRINAFGMAQPHFARERPMVDSPDLPPDLLSLLNQIAGAVLGGVVGGFAGFIANRLLDIETSRRMRRNVGAALAAEIEAASEQLRDHYLPLLRADLQDAADGRIVYHRFRGERDYTMIFRALGVNVGLLPAPLPRDLAKWYAQFSIMLERAHELHDLFGQGGEDQLRHAVQIGAIQLADADHLLRAAAPLIEQLSAF